MSKVQSIELAIYFKIVPFKKDDAASSLSKCFQDWLDCRGSIKSSEEIKLLEQVKKFLEAHQKSRFISLDESNYESKEDEKVMKAVGYKKKGENRGYDFYVFAHGYEEMRNGANIQTANKILIDAGLLIPSSTTVYEQIRLPAGATNNKFYHFVFEDMEFEDIEEKSEGDSNE